MRRIPALLLAISSSLAGAAVPEPPSDSIYQLSMKMTDQAGATVSLDVFRNRPVLISMFYGSCPHVCPLLVATIQQIERQLPAAARQRTSVLLVSLDPQRDTPEQLATLAGRHNTDLARWKFARVEPDDVRKLAAVLNVQYRRLPDGEFNHSTVISLLSPTGRITAQTTKLGMPDPDFVKAVAESRP